MCSFTPSLLRSFMNVCLRECVNALMKIKRWFWRTVSELGLEGWKIGRLEEGRGGRMECWLSEVGFSGLEDWRVGRVEGGKVGCLKRDLQDFRIGGIGNGSPVRFETALTGLGDHLSVFPFQTGSIRLGDGSYGHPQNCSLQFPFQSGSIRLSD